MIVLDNGENLVLEHIVDSLLLNKSVLFLSDKITYSFTVFGLKEIYEDVPLYAFSYSDKIEDSMVLCNNFDEVVIYLSNEKEDILNKFNFNNLVIF